MWSLHYLCAIVTKTGMWQQNLVKLYRNTWWFFGSSEAVICEQMGKCGNVNGALFAIFYCELAQNLCPVLLLPIPKHICRSEFYFVSYQKLQR